MANALHSSIIRIFPPHMPTSWERILLHREAVILNGDLNLPGCLVVGFEPPVGITDNDQPACGRQGGTCHRRTLASGPNGLACFQVQRVEPSDIAVALRCGLLEGKEATLYAGAGFVAGSEPEQELAETDAKFSVMRAALAATRKAQAA